MELSIMAAAGLARRLPVSDSVRRAHQFLEANWRTEVTLDAIAGAAYCSKFHLLRKFRGELGVTPHHYLLLRRLEGARVLLLQGVAPSKTAYQCGFSDQAHLTRYFKRMFGMPPVAYVRAIRGGSAGAALLSLPIRGLGTAPDEPALRAA